MLSNSPRRPSSASQTKSGKTADGEAALLKPEATLRKAPAVQSPASGRSPIRALEATLASMRSSSVHVDNPGLVLQRLVDGGFGNLPLPGAGRTLLRWQALAAVAAFDLSLAKLFEAHADALAIQAELGMHASPDTGIWGVWCAEPPDARLNFFRTETIERTCLLEGRKAWCSGAEILNYVLVSAWDDKGEQCLAAVPLNQPGITVTDEGWKAVGMQRSLSVDVIFENVVGVPVGAPGAYTARPGFWHGGAGVAACWYGAAAEIARRLHEAVTDHGDAHGKAHLGAVDVALCSAAAVLREAASFIDANPQADAMRMAFRARLSVEKAATAVIEHATRALGAGPLCRDAHFARMVADLPVFLRQSHAERDLQALGEALADTQGQGNESVPNTSTEVRADQWKL